MRHSVRRNILALCVSALALLIVPLSVARGGEHSSCGGDSPKVTTGKTCPHDQECPPATCQVSDTKGTKESLGGGDQEKTEHAAHEHAAGEKAEHSMGTMGENHEPMMAMGEHHKEMMKNLDQLEGILHRVGEGNLSAEQQKELGANGEAVVHKMKKSMDKQHEKMGATMGEMKHGAASQPASQPTSQPTGEKSELMNNFCPISGDAVSPDVKTEHNGKTVYFCCKDCIATFKKDPTKYMAKLPQFGGKE
ncbi:MAG: hypothetical protein V2A74_09945 [bacterium]